MAPGIYHMSPGIYHMSEDLEIGEFFEREISPLNIQAYACNFEINTCSSMHAFDYEVSIL